LHVALSIFFSRACSRAGLIGELLAGRLGVTRLERAGDAIIGGASRFTGFVKSGFLRFWSDLLGELVTNALAAWVRHDEGFAVVFLSWFGLLVWENELWTWAEVLWLIVVVVVDRWKSERVKDEGKEV